MSRAVSTDLSEFIKFLRRGNKYSPTTQAVLPSGVRWVFQHFDGEWPPDGIAVAAALQDSDLAATTVSSYRTGWAAYLDYLSAQGYDVNRFRVPARSQAERRGFGRVEVEAVRGLVGACVGCSLPVLLGLTWPRVKFNRDYIMFTGTSKMIAFDPATTLDHFLVIARWGFNLPHADDDEVLAQIKSSGAPLIPKMPGSQEPVELATLRRWLAKYA